MLAHDVTTIFVKNKNELDVKVRKNVSKKRKKVWCKNNTCR